MTIGLGTAYGVAALAYAVRPRLGDRVGLIELVDDFAPWYYVPGPAVALAGLWLGSHRLALAGLGAAAVFAVRWGPRFREPPSSTAAGGAALTVMTFNVLFRNRRPRATVAAIAAEDPDLVALQELPPGLAAHLVRALGQRYPHRVFVARRSPSGVGVASRYPLRDVRHFRLSRVGHWGQRMIVDAPSGPITVFNVHPYIPRLRLATPGPKRWSPVWFDSGRRRAEIRRLLELVDRVHGPLLVLGDFNMTEYSADYRSVKKRLGDAWLTAGRGLGLTFPRALALPRLLPSPWPLLRIDYAWFSPELRPVWARSAPSGGSDHRPVVVRFANAEA